MQRLLDTTGGGAVANGLDSGSLAPKLSELGLTSYEARAYVALIGRDTSTASEVARLAGVPRQRVYDVLGSLVGKGLAATRPGDVVKYSAEPPALAVERLVEAHRERLAHLEEGAAAVIEELSPAYEDGQQQTHPLEYIEVLRDRRAINERFQELLSAVEREILVFTKPPYATPPQDNVEGLEVTRAHVARCVYELSVFDEPETVEGVRRFIEAGEEARFVPELPLKLVIIDETMVMFAMEDPVAGRSELTVGVVEHSSLAQLLKLAFNAVWEAGLTFEEAAARALQPAGARA